MSTTRLQFFIAGLVAATVWAAAPSDAEAQKRIAVLDIEGARTSELRVTVAKLIRGEHQIVSHRKYERAARRMRARKLNPGDISKVAARVGVDGVIHGQIVMEDDRYYILRLRVHEGTNGRSVKKLAIRLRQPRLPGNIARKLEQRLLAAIDDVPYLEVAEDFDEPNFNPDLDAEEPPPEIQDEGFIEEDEGDTGETQVGMVIDRDDGDFEDDGDFDEADLDGGSAEAEIGTKGERERTRNGAIYVHAGMSLMNRSLDFNARSDLDPDLAPRGYSGAMAPAAHIDGEFYPLAIDAERKGIVKHIGVGFDFDRAFGLQTQVTDGMETVTLGTNHQAFGVGLRFRYNFGSRPKLPTLKVSVDYNKRTYDFDNPDGIDVGVPGVSYTYFDPGLALRVPVTSSIAVLGGVRALLITGAGDIQSIEQYGTAKLTGVDADLGLEYVLKKKYSIRAAARYMAIGYQFAGDGAEANSRDGDVDTVDVGGALDSYLGGMLTVGYMY